MISKYAQPKKDWYHYCKLASFCSFADKFGLTPKQLGENLQADYAKHELEQCEGGGEPSTLANDYVRSPCFTDAEQVLVTTRYMLALSMVREPLIRVYVRDMYRQHACVTMRPRMPRGLTDIDENHACYSLKYVTRKSCRELKDSRSS
jgi:transcription elongation factor SPT6